MKSVRRVDKQIRNDKSFKQIKILFVSHEYGVNGSTVSLISLIHGLRQQTEINVKVLLPYKRGKEGKASRLLKNNEISYKEMWYRRNFKSISEKYSLKYHIFDFMNMLAVRRIQKYIQKEKFDIVCSNSTGVDVGVRAARLAKVPHIYYVREFMKMDLNCEYRNEKRMGKLLESSEYVIFISKAIEAYYTVNYKLRNTVQFFNGFIIQNYYMEEHDILNEEKISFIQAGTFSDGKGTLNTIEMLYQLNQKGISNWHIEFIGGGTEEYIQKMQNLISKYHLEAQISIGDFCLDMKNRLSQKDILIMNSMAEGFGRVTVEGMLAGCLVMGRYSGGTVEIIEDQINGIAFKTEEEFLNAVHQILMERKKYRKLAKNGQKYALEKFDCVNTAKNFMKVVEECLK